METHPARGRVQPRLVASIEVFTCSAVLVGKAGGESDDGLIGH